MLRGRDAFPELRPRRHRPQSADALVANVRAAMPQPYANIVCPDAHAYMGYVADFYSGGSKIPVRFHTEDVAGPKGFNTVRGFDRFRARPGDPVLILRVQDSYVILGAVAGAIGTEEPPTDTVPPDTCENSLTFGAVGDAPVNPFGGSSAVLNGNLLISGNGIQARFEINDLSQAGIEIGQIDLPGGFQTSIVETYLTYGYITYSNTIKVIDISDPATPTEITAGVVNTGSLTPSVLYRDDLFLFAASTTDTEVQVYFLGNPAAPQLVTTFDAQAFVSGITGSGTTIIVATDGNAFEVWDFTITTAPIRRSTTAAAGITNQFSHISYRDQKLFYYDGTNNLAKVYNVSNQAAPSLLRSWTPALSSVTNLDIVGIFVFLFNAAEFEVWDASDIDNSLPVSIAREGLGGGSHTYGLVSDSWVVASQGGANQFHFRSIFGDVDGCDETATESGNLDIQGLLTALGIETVDLTVTGDADFQSATFEASVAIGGSLLVGEGIATFSQAALAVHPFGSAAGETGEARFYELSANGQHYIALKAPDELSASFTLVWPVDDGTAGQVLQTDGSGVLSWVDPSAAAGQYREFVYTINGSGDVLIVTSGGEAVYTLRDLE